MATPTPQDDERENEQEQGGWVVSDDALCGDHMIIGRAPTPRATAGDGSEG